MHIINFIIRLLNIYANYFYNNIVLLFFFNDNEEDETFFTAYDRYYEKENELFYSLLVFSRSRQAMGLATRP